MKFCARSSGLLSSLLLAIFLLQSCSSGGSTAVEIESDSDEFVSFQIDVNVGAIPFSELVEKAELMRLEETEESLLSYVTQLHETSDSYVFTSGKEKDVYVYSKEGEYKSKFNRKGDGPEEYTNINSMWLEGEDVYVYISKKATVKRYDLEGNFKSSWQLPENGDQIVPYDEGYVMNMGDRPLNDSLNFRILYLNKDFAQDSLFLPYESPNRVSITSSINGFRSYKNGLIYLKSLGDTVHYLEGMETKPIILLDLGNDWLWKNQALRDDYAAGLEAVQTSEKIWNLAASINESYAYLSYFMKFEPPKNIILDRRTGSYKRIFLGREDNALSISPLYWDGDRLLMSIASEHVEDFLSQLEDDQWTFRKGTTLDRIESSEHRVMMWVKLKEGVLAD